MLNFVRANAQYLSSVTTVTPPTSGSVSVWVTPTTLANTEYIINLATNSFFIAFASNGNVTARFRANATITVAGGFAAGTRYFVTGTWTPVLAQTLQTLYLNAVSRSSGTNNTTATGTLTLFVGASAVTTNTLNGTLEDLRFYNRVLTLPEIQTIYNCKGTDSIVHGLTSRYFMNDKSGATTGAGSIKDTGPVQNNLSPGGTTGTPTYTWSLLKQKRFLQL